MLHLFLKDKKKNYRILDKKIGGYYYEKNYKEINYTNYNAYYELEFYTSYNTRQVSKAKKDNIFKKIFKYSTPYVSYSEANSLQGNQTFYVTQSSELIETTVKNPNNFAFNFGIRKNIKIWLSRQG